MKVLTIMGSPRKSAASTVIAEQFNRTAEANGAEVTTYHLNDMDYKACQGCYACKTGHETCALSDDLTQVFEDLHEADAVVFATPIYFGDVTGQFKSFFDRIYSTVKPDYLTTGIPSSRLPAGKKSLFIFTQGADEETHTEIHERYNNYLAISGFTDIRTIRDCKRQDYTDKNPAAESITLAEAAAMDFVNA